MYNIGELHMHTQYRSNHFRLVLILLFALTLLPISPLQAQGESVCHPAGYCAVAPRGMEWIGGYDRDRNRLAIQTDTIDVILLAINVTYFPYAGSMTSPDIRFKRIDLNLEDQGLTPLGEPELVTIAGFAGVRQNFQSQSDSGVLMLLTGGQDIEIIVAGRTNGVWTNQKEKLLLQFANSLIISPTLRLSQLSGGRSDLPSAPVYTPIPDGVSAIQPTSPPPAPDQSAPKTAGDPTYTQAFFNGLIARLPAPDQIGQLRSVWRGIDNYVDPRSPSIQVYSHTIPSSQGPQIFSFRFCVDAKDEVQRMFGLVKVNLLVNGEAVSDQVILVLDNASGLCRRWSTLLDQWTVGDSVVLEIRYTYTQNLLFNDGTLYRAGDYIQRIEALVVR